MTIKTPIKPERRAGRSRMSSDMLARMLAGILVGSIGVLAVHGEMVVATSTVGLRGGSKGGVLTLRPASGEHVAYVAVTNRAGETAKTVILRLAQALLECGEMNGLAGSKGALSVGEDHLRLGLPGGKGFPGWYFGGTDLGFNIPRAPTCLSVRYETERIIVQWLIEDEYDSVGVFMDWHPLYWPQSGTSNSFVVPKGHYGWQLIHAPWRETNFTVTAIGVKDGTPSNGVMVRLRDRVRQECMFTAPFTAGVAPGFRTWCRPEAKDPIVPEQSNPPDMGPCKNLWFSKSRGFYQILKGRGAYCGGVSRRFLGLLPGHRYRVGARLNTLESREGRWSFSLHAAADPANGAELTPDQLAGMAPLPNGAKGKTAAQIARYDASRNTAGAWVQCDSGSTGAENFSGDIALPANGSDSITIWFRLEGETAQEIAVGFDSLWIEDLGPAK